MPEVKWCFRNSYASNFPYYKHHCTCPKNKKRPIKFQTSEVKIIVYFFNKNSCKAAYWCNGVLGKWISVRMKNHHLKPLRTRGRNSRSNKWLNGPWPTSCSSPRYISKNIIRHTTLWKVIAHQANEITSKFYCLYIKPINAKLQALQGCHAYEDTFHKYDSQRQQSNQIHNFSYLVVNDLLNSHTSQPIHP